MKHSDIEVPIIVSYGGGVNSTAMLLGMIEMNIRPAAVLFADTGGELPETYEYVKLFSGHLVTVNLPAIVWVTLRGPDETLEAECLRKSMLPSLAYGGRSCSVKWKKDAQRQWLKASWLADKNVCGAIGFDADEGRRAITGKDIEWYPLIDWNWGRQECVDAIKRAGLPVPPKSSCFFCPARKKHEIIQLANCHPDLFDRACVMEERAQPNLNVVKGLGRHWRWSDLVRMDRAQMSLIPEARHAPCLCEFG